MPHLILFPLSLERFFSQPGLVTVSGGRLSRIYFPFHLYCAFYGSGAIRLSCLENKGLLLEVWPSV